MAKRPSKAIIDAQGKFMKGTRLQPVLVIHEGEHMASLVFRTPNGEFVANMFLRTSAATNIGTRLVALAGMAELKNFEVAAAKAVTAEEPATRRRRKKANPKRP